jgi:hypothetical protein
LCTNFLCEIFPNDYNLRALIKNTSFCTQIVYQHINLPQREGELSFAFSCQLQHRDRVYGIAADLLEGASLNTAGAKALNELLADGRAGGENMGRGDLVKFTFQDPVHYLFRQKLILRTGLVAILRSTGIGR